MEKDTAFTQGQRNQAAIPGWLCFEVEDDDFLIGPKHEDETDTWEDEE